VGRTVDYRLGRNCVLAINGLVYYSVRSASIRQVPVSIDATPRGMNVTSTATVVIARSMEIEFDLADISEAQRLYVAAASNAADVEVSLAGGFWVGTKRFTVHDVEASEDVSGIVLPRFLLKEKYIDAQLS